MAQYTYAQLEQLWINAGGPRSQAALAAAIAEAESSGNSQATNPTDNNGTQTSWGLWQISNGTHAMPVPGILTPSVNAQQAVAKYNGAGNTFSPWGTYESGAYRAFLNGKTTPDPNVPGSTAQGILTAAQAQQQEQDCLWFIGYPGSGLAGWLGDLAHGNVVGALGFGNNKNTGGGSGFCAFSRGEARAVVGGLLIGAGGIIAGAGLIVVLAGGLARTKSFQKAADAAAVVPGARGLAVAAQAAHGRVSRTGGSVTRDRGAARREAARRRERDRAEAAGE